MSIRWLPLWRPKVPLSWVHHTLGGLAFWCSYLSSRRQRLLTLGASSDSWSVRRLYLRSGSKQFLQTLQSDTETVSNHFSHLISGVHFRVIKLHPLTYIVRMILPVSITNIPALLSFPIYINQRKQQIVCSLICVAGDNTLVYGWHCLMLVCISGTGDPSTRLLNSSP